MTYSVRKAIDEEMARIREAGADDHFYGPWAGPSKAAGGGPVVKGGGYEHPVAKAGSAEEALGAIEDNTVHYATSAVDDSTEQLEGYLQDNVFAGVPWEGEPNSIAIVKTDKQPAWSKKIGTRNETNVLYRGDDGKPVGWFKMENSISPGAKGSKNEGQWHKMDHGIQSVVVFKSARGKGYGTKMYDAVQDSGKINLYQQIGRSDSFTAQGKGFANAWLQSRIDRGL